MFLRYRFVFPLLIAAVVTACSNTGTPPKADIHPAKNSPVASVSPLTELVREAQAGNAKAQHILASKYQRGEDVPKDLAKGVAWEQKSAASGYAEAQAQLADDYDKGSGVPKDMNDSANWAQKAAAQGNAMGQEELGLLYLQGKGVTKDAARAVELFQKAATQGNVQAQLFLGLLYKKGNGVTKDAAKAVEWWQKAAANGSGYAQWELSLCYTSGDGCLKDSAKADEWYQKAFQQGNAKDQWDIGLCYEGGNDDCSKDSSKAVEWFERAAAHGDAEYQDLLAGCYYNGFTCPKDLTKSVEWYQKAAAEGDADASVHLGDSYLYGDGVTKDATKAIQMYEKAAAQGDARAIDSLGTAYENGEGVIKDEAKAIELLQEAAAQGYLFAFTQLSDYYLFNGRANHNRHDWVLAYAWANIGAAHGGRLADSDSSLRDHLEEHLTQAEIAEGQRLSASWKPENYLSHENQQSSAASPKANEHPTKQETGTLFVVDPTGLAVTNEHVINSCRELRLKGRDGVLKVVAEDVANDLALVRLPDHTAAVATISESDRLRQGDDIAVFGFPLDGVLASGGNLTTGVISGLTGPRNNTTQFQITAAIQPGSSGSPVINDEGDVLGVVSSKLSDEVMAKATGSVGESVNFAIRAQELKAFLEANHVNYASDAGHWFSHKKNSADIADSARKWTFMVECWK